MALVLPTLLKSSEITHETVIVCVITICLLLLLSGYIRLKCEKSVNFFASVMNSLASVCTATSGLILFTLILYFFVPDNIKYHIRKLKENAL
jgi:ABC-type tungstate transport system substrate-binding protein